MNMAARGVLPMSEFRTVRPQLPALTSLRFFAAAAIVLHHTQGTYGLPHVSDYLGQGVTLFFVLSGFLMFYNYPQLETAGARWTFLVRRFARIWPAHVAGIVLVLLIDGSYATGAAPASVSLHLWLNLAMVQTWVPLAWLNYSFNGPSWSIATEFGFYCLFPLLILDFARTWWWKLGLSAVLVVALIVGCNAFKLAPPTGYGDGLNFYSVMYLNPAARLLEFVLGMCAALAWRNFDVPAPAPSVAGTIAELAAVLFLLGGPAIGNAIYFAVPSLQSPAATTWLVNSGMLVLPAAVLIAVLAANRGWIGHTLSWGPFVFLGEISYAIYLVHYTLSRWIVTHPDLFAGVPAIGVLAIYLSAVFALSTTIFVCVERPAQRIIRALIPRPLASPA